MTVSVRTVQRRLNEIGCKNRVARVVPKLTNKMKAKRLEFVRMYQHCTVDVWNKVSQQKLIDDVTLVILNLYLFILL